MKKFFKFAVVALAAAAVVVACQKPATNNEQKQEEEQQKPDDQPKTANLFVLNTPGWEAPALWAWGNDAIKMPGDWPNGIEPEAGVTLLGDKEYLHFVLNEAFIGEGIGFLIVNKTKTDDKNLQTVDVAGLTINDGDNLKYEIGAEAGADGKFPLTKVE